MAILNAIAFLFLAIHYRFSISKKRIVVLTLFGWICFLLLGSLGAFYNSVPFGVYGRAIYPFILFTEGLLAAYWLSKESRYCSSLIEFVIYSSIVSLFFTFFWGMKYTGLSLANIRYQILSPSIAFLITVMGFDLFISGYKRIRAFIILATAIALIFISTTRGILLAVGLPISVLILVWILSILRTKKMVLRKPWIRGGLIFGGTGIIATLIFSFNSSLMLERWILRLSGEGKLVSFWTRVAAVVDQWDQLVQQPISWFIGRGFGQSYFYSKKLLPYVFSYVNYDTFSKAMTYPGEFMWMSLFFYAGLIGGFFAVWVLLTGMGLSFRFLLNSINRRSRTFLQSRNLWISVLGYFSLIGLTFTSNPFILRQTAFLFGILLGIIITKRKEIYSLELS